MEGVWHRVEALSSATGPRRSSLEAARSAGMMEAVARCVYVLRPGPEAAFAPVFRLTRGARTADVPIAE